MRISEMFYSIQGEGFLCGVPSFFVRTTGCNLRCSFCDSPHTSWNPEGEEHSLDKIMEIAAKHPSRHVVITGGEPYLQNELPELCDRFKDAGYHITIETAGTVFKPLHADLLSISPKLSNSIPRLLDDGKHAQRHDAARMNAEVLRSLIAQGDYQLKFVVDAPDDLKEIEFFLKEIGGVERSRVLLMPQGITRKELDERSGWLVEYCKKQNYRYCPRLHIELYGNKRGT